MSGKINGWANYPTWAVVNWLYEEPQYEEIANSSANSQELAVQIRDLVEKNISETGMYADLLAWAITQVDWDQIAAWKDEENN